MKNVLVVASALLLAAATSANAGDLKSGLQVGEFPGAFNVLDCTGPAKGKSLCYRCRYGGKPVVTIFTRSIDENVTKLVKEVDSAVGANQEKDLKAFVVLLTDDPDAAEPQLKKLAKDAGISENVPLTVFDGEAGPPEYKISKDAGVTVMLWVKSDVKANYAFENGKLDAAGVKTIIGDTSKILE